MLVLVKMSVATRASVSPCKNTRRDIGLSCDPARRNIMPSSAVSRHRMLHEFSELRDIPQAHEMLA